MNFIDPLRPPVQQSITRPLSGTERHRQHGEVDSVPQGTIVTSKPGDWVWTLLSVVLILAVCTINFWVPMLSKLIGT